MNIHRVIPFTRSYNSSVFRLAIFYLGYARSELVAWKCASLRPIKLPNVIYSLFVVTKLGNYQLEITKNFSNRKSYASKLDKNSRPKTTQPQP